MVQRIVDDIGDLVDGRVFTARVSAANIQQIELETDALGDFENTLGRGNGPAENGRFTTSGSDVEADPNDVDAKAFCFAQQRWRLANGVATELHAQWALGFGGVATDADYHSESVLSK